MDMMNWEQLLNCSRMGKARNNVNNKDPRHEFQKDFDRFIFSSSFRALKDKTQVFSMVKDTYIRDRFSHSLEVASVGRSLGEMVGDYIIEKHGLSDTTSADIGTLVAAGCLAHDIGHPPLAHAGEDAIRQWFKESPLATSVMENFTDLEKSDFLNYEGNAQNFRLVNRLQSPGTSGGMQLTYATLASFAKYPCDSSTRSLVKMTHRDSASFKKMGYFQADKALFEEMAEEVGLLKAGDGAWHRHPLTYLVEAADDICYSIVDIEDAHRMGYVSYRDALALIKPLAGRGVTLKKLQSLSDDQERVEYLRAKAIGNMASQAAEVFINQEDKLLRGEFEGEILNHTRLGGDLMKLKIYAAENVYVAESAVDIRVSGYGMIEGLLNAFVASVEDIAQNGSYASSKSKMYIRLIPSKYLEHKGQPKDNGYERMIGVTDFISGLSDTQAVDLYKKISGISLPNG